MGVIVDNVTYPLTSKENLSVLYSGNAPVAQSGYRYVKIEKANNNTEVEPFFRNPVQNDTLNEYFKRTWNSYTLPQLPTVFPPLNAIHRINSSLHIDGQIPTIHLVANQTEIDKMHASNSTEDISVMSNMSYIALNDTQGFEGVEISLAGRSSRWLPKLSYNLKLHKKDTLYDYRRIKLRALNTDPSYIREQLAYDIIKSVGLASSEFSFCRLFLNNQEIGLFGLIDTFKDPWLANIFANGDSKYKNGDLFQGLFGTPESMALNLTSDLSYYTNLTLYEQGQYKIKQEAYGSKKDDYKPLQKFTKFIKEAPTNSSDAVEKWQKKLDTDSFLRSMALEVLLGYADGYLTMADNFYVYDNPETEQFFYISSDMDLTQGSTIFNLDQMWSGNYSTFPNIYSRPLMSKILQVPEFKQQYDDLLVNITQQLTNPVVLNDRINKLVEMLEEDIKWDSSLPRVANNLLSQMGASLNNGNSGVDSAAAAVIGNQMPPGMDINVLSDFGERLNSTVPLQEAVNGPTGHASLSGVKEWYQKISENILDFYNASNFTVNSTNTTL